MAPYFTSDGVRAHISNELWAVTAAVGACLCFPVLVVIAAMYSYSGSRAHLDRVSFRLILYSLITNMLFGIVSAIAGTLTGPSVGCGLVIFLLQLTLQLSSFLLFCIALNLQLVVVHGVRGKHLEKYYVACSSVMSLILTIPPYAAGQYGWDPLESVCWYTNDNHQQRLAWQIGTQLFWIALTVTGEVVTACTVTIYMLRARYRQKRIFSAATLSRSSLSSQPQRKNRSPFNSSIASLKPTSIHANTYAHVIARIALYPAASCVINMTSVVTVMHSTTSNGIQNANDYDILLLSDFLYGGRVIVYAILAATDMALIRAVRAFVAHHMHWNWGSTTISRSHTATGTHISAAQAHRKGLAVQVELSTFVSSDCADGGSRANLATDSKARQNIESTQEAMEDDPTSCLGEDVQIPPPAMDKAERGVLADLEHTDEPSLNQPRTVAFQLSSPITSSSQSILHRQEEMVREQAEEEEEFMRII